MKTKTIVSTYKSPIGTFYIEVSDSKIHSVSTTPIKSSLKGENQLSKKVTHALSQYFKSKNDDAFKSFKFSDFYTEKATSFQRKVWKNLFKIKNGKTVSYKDIAAAVGSPKASRAVGGAVGKNPFLIILPCHRVLGSDKSLTGFSAGMEKKVFLLKHEGVL